MKRNKLFTAIAAVALLGSTGAAFVQPNTPVAQAAKKSKKKSKKAAKYATVRIRRGAPAYKIKIKGNKVTKVSRLTRKHKKQSFGGGKSYVFWSFKHKKTTYYYVGGTTAVRAKDAKRVGKKRIPSLNSIVQKAVDERNAKVEEWNNKLNAARPATFPAKVTTESNYYVIGSDNKLVQATDKLAVGTQLTIMYKIDGLFQSGDGTTFAGYIAQTSDKKVIAISSRTVTLDDPSAQVLNQDQYSSSNKNVEEIYEAAKKDLGIKDTNN